MLPLPNSLYQSSFSLPSLLLWSSSVLVDKRKALYPALVGPHSKLATNSMSWAHLVVCIRPLKITEEVSEKKSASFWTGFMSMHNTNKSFSKKLTNSVLFYNQKNLFRLAAKEHHISLKSQGLVLFSMFKSSVFKIFHMEK